MRPPPIVARRLDPSSYSPLSPFSLCPLLPLAHSPALHVCALPCMLCVVVFCCGVLLWCATTVWEKHVLRPTWDAMACATAATSGTPKTQLDVVFWATMESVVIVVYVSIAFMGVASLLHDAEQAHRWAPQDTLGARRAAQYSNAPNAKKPPVSPL